ncbi:hypothetical protein, partial [Dysosmobacter welbionis]|uniref:hypothetical protein n=1 Tax=Dysosmobacter welbionis TaxID=2093857 RepID=UPI00307923A1
LPTLGRPHTVIMATFLMFDIGDPQLSLSIFAGDPAPPVSQYHTPAGKTTVPAAFLRGDAGISAKLRRFCSCQGPMELVY